MNRNLGKQEPRKLFFPLLSSLLWCFVTVTERWLMYQEKVIFKRKDTTGPAVTTSLRLGPYLLLSLKKKNVCFYSLCSYRINTVNGFCGNKVCVGFIERNCILYELLSKQRDNGKLCKRKQNFHGKVLGESISIRVCYHSKQTFTIYWL